MKELPVEVTPESLAFNEKYKAFSDDEIEGMKRLNPAVLSAINQLNELYHRYLILPCMEYCLRSIRLLLHRVSLQLF